MTAVFAVVIRMVHEALGITETWRTAFAYVEATLMLIMNSSGMMRDIRKGSCL